MWSIMIYRETGESDPSHLWPPFHIYPFDHTILHWSRCATATNGRLENQRLQVNGNGQLMPLTPDLRMKEQQPIHEVCSDAKPGVGVTVAHEGLGVLAKPEFSGKGIIFNRQQAGLGHLFFTYAPLTQAPT